MQHDQQSENPNAIENYKNAFKTLDDGLNTIQYKTIQKRLYTSFTHFLFDIGT